MPVMAIIRFRRNTAETWTSANILLGPGEPGYERDTGKLKVGDGSTKWNDLNYFIPDDYIRQLIQNAIDEVTIGDGSEAAHQELVAHINSLTPHPIYDDGPSFLLLYQNAKV